MQPCRQSEQCCAGYSGDLRAHDPQCVGDRPLGSDRRCGCPRPRHHHRLRQQHMVCIAANMPPVCSWQFPIHACCPMLVFQLHAELSQVWHYPPQQQPWSYTCTETNCFLSGSSVDCWLRSRLIGHLKVISRIQPQAKQCKHFSFGLVSKQDSLCVQCRLPWPATRLHIARITAVHHALPPAVFCCPAPPGIWLK